MSLAENLLPSRNGSRHKKGDMTRVQSALSEPLPGGIDQAVAKVKAAIEAFDVALVERDDRIRAAISRAFQTIIVSHLRLWCSGRARRPRVKNKPSP